MFKLSVPISTKTINKDNREIYLKQIREAGVDRIFLCGVGEPVEEIPERIVENVRFFKDNGYDVGIWLASIGHGFVLIGAADAEEKFSQIETIKGEKMHHANCPMDAEFRTYFAQFVAKLAKTGADIIMLDDDFRMSQREEDVSCACPLHLKRIGEILGEDITREKLFPSVVSGEANKYRDAFLQAQEEGIMLLAKEIRTQVDKESSHVTVCTCTSLSPWNVGGYDVIEVSRILAGKNKPILRLTGAPYWTSSGRFTLPASIEEARMLASFCKNSGIELMCEGDTYPRPRYICPASYLELYDTAIRADGGYDGILKYMFDYVAGPEFETGYLKYHSDYREYREMISEWFSGGANAGVRVFSYPHTMKDADLDLSSLEAWSPISIDGAMLANNGIPTVYHGEGICNSVFGENARKYDFSELKNGTILDAVSAIILTQRGIDVGIKSYADLTRQPVNYLCTNDPTFKSFIRYADARILSTELQDGAKSVLYMTQKEKQIPMAYTYENANGERFLVFLFEGDSLRTWTATNNSMVTKNPATADVLIKALPWVARRELPAYCTGNPELMLICKKDTNSLTVTLFNCFADALANPVIILDEAYTNIECTGCEAQIVDKSVILTSKLYGFTSAAFRVSK